MQDIVPIIALLIPIAAIVMINWRKVQERKLAAMEQGASPLAAAAQERIEKLEARVAVLERIITDSGSRLSRDIEDLRH